MTTRRAAGNKGLNAMGAEVVNSTFVLLLSFCGLLNICASNPPTASSAKPLCAIRIHQNVKRTLCAMN
ncbi:MAG: hypothetical protein BWY23_02250 [Spirochaetes bacterium ADurb.Bin218]|nr:MAG: hypothetical protein BWY23_02250 [Spirochaetes bacterium ADurb.Bin218]